MATVGFGSRLQGDRDKGLVNKVPWADSYSCSGKDAERRIDILWVLEAFIIKNHGGWPLSRVAAIPLPWVFLMAKFSVGLIPYATIVVNW